MTYLKKPVLTSAFPRFFLLFFSLSLSPAFAVPHGEEIKLTTHQTPIGQSVYVLDIDPHRTQIVAAHANDQLPGRQTLSQMAKNFGALAGINGGFFRLSVDKNGFPAGVLKIDEDWYGVSYQKRAAIGWRVGEGMHIDRIETKTSLSINRQPLKVHRLNPSIAPPSQKAALFTPIFGDNTLSIANDQTACLFTKNRVIQHLSSSTGRSVHLQRGQYLFVAPPETKLDKICIPDATVALYFSVQPSTSDADWNDLDFIVGGSPLLIKDGQLIHDYRVERLPNDFVKQLHARSAIGLLSNGHWVFVVADQNLLNKDVGMTLSELARFMKKLGCVHALNMDGGISSSLYFQGKLINQPWFEREIGDAILVLPIYPKPH